MELIDKTAATILTNNNLTINFGASAFKYPVPSGYKAIL